MKTEGQSSTFHLIAIWEIATSLTALAMTDKTNAWESSTFYLIAIWGIATSLTALAMTLLFIIINKPKVYNSENNFVYLPKIKSLEI